MTVPAEATGSGVPVGPLVIVTVAAIELTCSIHEPVAECPKVSFTVTEMVQGCCVPVAFEGAVHVGDGVDPPGENVPFPMPPVQDALHAYVSGCEMESVATTFNVTLPAEPTGSGVPVGPLVIETVSGIELTCSDHDPAAECPKPSLTVIESVHVCWAPVALAGAVHVGVATAAFGTKLPLPSPPVHAALHE